MQERLIRLGWFAGIWFSSVVCLALVSYGLRLWLK